MNVSGNSRRPAAHEAAAGMGWLRTIVHSVANWHGGKPPYQARSSLLNDHVRKDIGVSRADAWRQARKPSWQD